MSSNEMVVEYGDPGQISEYIVPPSGIGDLIRFERKFGVPSNVFDKNDPTPLKLEWIAYLVFLALQRQGVTAQGEDFEAFLDKLEAVKPRGAADDDDESAGDVDETADLGHLDQPPS